MALEVALPQAHVPVIILELVMEVALAQVHVPVVTLVVGRIHVPAPILVEEQTQANLLEAVLHPIPVPKHH